MHDNPPPLQQLSTLLYYIIVRLDLILVAVVMTLTFDLLQVVAMAVSVTCVSSRLVHLKLLYTRQTQRRNVPRNTADWDVSVTTA